MSRAADHTRSKRGTEPRLGRALLLGAGAGLLAMAATAAADRLSDPLIEEEQRARERRVREGSPHAIAGSRLGARIAGHELDARQARGAQALFTVAYGLLWGVVYAAVRRGVPSMSRALGLPFAVPFYLACDGVIAPALGLTPPPQRVPWQLDVKELGNHAVWTAAAELLLRGAERMEPRSWR